MTLFIACLLIYHYNMEWWWYGIALGVWIGHLHMNPMLLSAIYD